MLHCPAKKRGLIGPGQPRRHISRSGWPGMAARPLIRHATNRRHLGRLQIVRPAHRLRKHKNIASEYRDLAPYRSKVAQRLPRRGARWPPARGNTLATGPSPAWFPIYRSERVLRQRKRIESTDRARLIVEKSAQSSRKKRHPRNTPVKLSCVGSRGRRVFRHRLRTTGTTI
jgi:hypothetical protein